MHVSMQSIYNATEAVQAAVVPVVVVNIVVVGSLTPCVLINSVWDLRRIHSTVKRSLIPKTMLYKCKLSHNAREGRQIICCVSNEGVYYHYIVNLSFKVYILGFKSFDD